MVDQDYKILSRNKFVTLNLPTDKFGQEETNNSLLSKINIRFDHVGDEEVDQSQWKQYADDLRQFNGDQSFDTKKIEAKRSGLNAFKEKPLQAETPMTKSAETVTIP